jgi:hypothetical protein
MQGPLSTGLLSTPLDGVRNDASCLQETPKEVQTKVTSLPPEGFSQVIKGFLLYRVWEAITSQMFRPKSQKFKSLVSCSTGVKNSELHAMFKFSEPGLNIPRLKAAIWAYFIKAYSSKTCCRPVQ